MVLNEPLDARVRFERRVETQDPDYGTPIITWSLVPNGVVWANVKDVLPSLRREEGVAAGGGLQTDTRRTRVRIRYRSDIDTTMRVIIYRPSAIIYQIVSGPAEMGQHEYLELMVERYSTQGA